MLPLKLQELFAEAGGRTSLPAGGMLFVRGDRVQNVYFLVQGDLVMARYHRDGRMLILANSRPGTMIAEASVYATAYHCDGLTRDGADLNYLSSAHFRERMEQDTALSRAWAAFLAGQLQQARFRSEILTRRTVADRLTGWLEINGKLPRKGTWHMLAAELAVSPEALYREISHFRSLGRHI